MDDMEFYEIDDGENNYYSDTEENNYMHQESNIEENNAYSNYISQESNIDTNTIRPTKTSWIVFALAISLIVILIIATIVFFYLFNTPPMHEIIIENNCAQNINVIFGAQSSNFDIVFLPVISIEPNIRQIYKVTPGVSIYVQGFSNTAIRLPNKLNPFTTAQLILAGQGFNGSTQISDGINILNNLYFNDNSVDTYGVSVQGGYNYPISIVPTNGTRDPNNVLSCASPSWNYSINSTGPNSCPIELQSPTPKSDYQVCMSPCTAFDTSSYCCDGAGACSGRNQCQTSWPDPPNYYKVFSEACPNCLITNCDKQNYSCSSTRNGLTQYLITFCPSLR